MRNLSYLLSEKTKESCHSEIISESFHLDFLIIMGVIGRVRKENFRGYFHFFARLNDSEIHQSFPCSGFELEFASFDRAFF